MAIRDIHLLGSPVLRQRADEIGAVDDEVRRLVDDMFETMAAANGVGLAANQIGVARRVAVINADTQTFAMINPRIVEASSEREGSEEGCLSIPDIYGEVQRPARVVLEALDEDGEPFRLEATGLTARAIQHELDHLDGVLFTDRLSVLKRESLLRRYRREHQDEGLTYTPRPEESKATD